MIEQGETCEGCEPSTEGDKPTGRTEEHFAWADAFVAALIKYHQPLCPRCTDNHRQSHLEVDGQYPDSLYCPSCLLTLEVRGQ